MVEQVLGAVTAVSKVVDVTLTVNTSAYASGDLLADAQEIANVFREDGATGVLHSVCLLDKADQGTAIDLYFTDDSTSWGTENAALGPADGVADGVFGVVQVVAADYVDLANSQIVYKNNLGMIVKGSGTSLYVAAACRSGTPTYAADSITLRLGFYLD